LTFVNAGHNPPLLRRDDGSIETLEAGGLILGMMCGVQYEQATIPLRAGDVLLMYTDGASEAMNGQNEEFGENRLRVFLNRDHSLPPHEALTALEREVHDFSGDDSLEDDFTLLWARVTATG
ncbi:serine/threonine-protein phosphatase, partial [candidate division KSB1 bacterium]